MTDITELEKKLEEVTTQLTQTIGRVDNLETENETLRKGLSEVKEEVLDLEPQSVPRPDDIPDRPKELT